MTDYTPTTEEVRERYWLNDGEPSDPDEGYEFDRWLAEYEQDAYERGYRDGYNDLSNYNDWYGGDER
jgi:hypothetical protein